MVLEDKYPYQLVKLDTQRGEIVCRYYSSNTHNPASVAVVYLTGSVVVGEHLQLVCIQGYVVLLQGSELMACAFAIGILLIY